MLTNNGSHIYELQIIIIGEPRISGGGEVGVGIARSAVEHARGSIDEVIYPLPQPLIIADKANLSAVLPINRFSQRRLNQTLNAIVD